MADHPYHGDGGPQLNIIVVNEEQYSEKDLSLIIAIHQQIEQVQLAIKN
jgi:hypothetical protein